MQRYKAVACHCFQGPRQIRLRLASDARHIIEMRLQGVARSSWPLAIRPLHDALIEDAFDRAESFINRPPGKREWSRWAKLLRRIMSRRRPSRAG